MSDASRLLSEEPEIESSLLVASQEARRAKQEKRRADLLAEKLRALGVDPESL